MRALVGRGDHVRCLLRPTSATERIDDLPIERAVGDVCDATSVGSAMQGCDAVVHLAGPAEWYAMSSALIDPVIVGGTANVLSAAAALGALRTVCVSSTMAVSGSREPKVHDETSRHALDLDRYPYARAKLRSEELCAHAASEGLPVVVVSPGEVYGPNDTSFVTAGALVDFAKSSPVLVCDGGAAVAHVDDVVAGIVAALSRGRPGERYILGGENVSVRRLAELTLALLGQKKRIVRLRRPALRAAATVSHALGLSFPFPPEMIPYATLYWFMDSSKAERDLGVSFRAARETLESTVRWLREAGHLS